MWTATEISAILLAAWGLFHWLKIFATFRALAVFTGVCLLGGGFLGHVLRRVAVWVSSLSTSLGHWALGVSIGTTILAVALAIIFVHDLHPRKQATARTSFVGIGLAALMVAGVTGITAFNHVPAGVQTGVTNARTAVSGG